jgi:hypothetical protein
MEFEIEKERTFDCPEGTFRAVFKGIRRDAKFKDGKLQELARMTFEARVPSMPDKIVTVARSFEPSIRPGSPMREMLKGWLGRQFFSENAGRKINLDGQMDKEAEIVVKHCHNEGFRKPYCHLLAILPPGSVALGEVEKN